MMKKMLCAIAYLSCLLCVNGYAQQINNACSQYISLNNAQQFKQSMESTLWTMNSDVWNGYIDFQRNGKYWTHWGYGQWSVNQAGVITMKNDYDPYSFQLMVNSQSYTGVRSDGVKVSGRLICAKYEQDLAIGSSYEEQEIRKIYLEVHHREPDPEGFRYWVNQYRKGYYTIEQIRQAAYDSPEYRNRIKKTSNVGINVNY